MVVSIPHSFELGIQNSAEGQVIATREAQVAARLDFRVVDILADVNIA